MPETKSSYLRSAASVGRRLVSGSSRLLGRRPPTGSQTPVGGSDTMRSTRAGAETIGHRPFNLADLTPADAPLPTIGAVDAVEALGGQLIISGWLLAGDLAEIDELVASPAGDLLPEADVRIGLPSPEIPSHLGAAPDSSAASARYRVQLPLSGAVADRPHGHVVTLLPYSGGRALRPVVVAHDTAIPMPTEALALRIGGGFLDVALEFMGYFQQLARLSPSDKVLEIGCGLGRMAYPLAYYLDDSGSYLGFDIDAELIGWAKDTIGAARGNFHFEHADVHNPHYNPAGLLTPESFHFPAPSEAIDVTLAVSLFTHLPAPVARHYLNETARVLRDGGTAFLTAFLVDDAASKGMAEGRAILHLGERAAGGWVADAANPEFAIGFPAADFLGWMAEAGLEVTAVYPGNWSGRAPFLSFQDIVVARRIRRQVPGSASGSDGATTSTR